MVKNKPTEISGKESNKKKVVNKKLKIPDVLKEEAQKGPKSKNSKSKDPCGELVYESPVQVNDEVGPDGDHKLIRFKILRYELCVKVVILDPNGGNRIINTIDLVRNPESGVTIHYPNGKTVHVQGYSKPAKGVVVGGMNGGEADFWGKFAVFVVDGCTDPKFVQFVNQTSTIGSNTTTTGWVVDGGKTAGDLFPGTLPKGNSDDGASSMTDWPGRFENPASGLAFGTTVDLTQEFETYVCCDGELIGYWSWNNHVSYTAKNGQRNNLNVDTGTPTWQRDPKTGKNNKKVKC